MASELERIAALETHYEHVDKTLTAMGRTMEAIHTDISGLRTEIQDVREMVRTEISGVRQMVHSEVEGVCQMVRSEVEGVRTELGGKLDDIVLRMADDKAAASETKLKVGLKVAGWLVGVVTTVLGAVIGGLFVFARFLLPKLATAMQDVGSAIT